MKRTRCYIVYIMSLFIVIGACKENDYPEDWQESVGTLDIHLDKNEIKQNEYLTLTFDGYVDSLLLFDGTLGHEYKHVNRTVMDGVSPKLSFSTYAQYGTQANTLSVLVSKDFNPNELSATGIQSATWTNITNRFTLSTGADNTGSGTADLSDIVADQKGIYFAFKFVGQTGSTQKTWTIKNFNLVNDLPTGVQQSVANTGNAGWSQYSFLGAGIWTFNASQLQIIGGDATKPSNEDWLISKYFYFNSVSPDTQSHLLKTRFQKMLNTYRLGYAKPGVYELVVLGKDKEGKEILKKTFNVTVTEK